MSSFARASGLCGGVPLLFQAAIAHANQGLYHPGKEFGMGGIHNPVKNHKAGKDAYNPRNDCGSGNPGNLEKARDWFGKRVPYHHTA